MSGAGRDGARPRSARVLVHADGDQGQKTIVAAAMHALQGAPAVSLSLASLIAEGEGEATRGVVKALREPLRCASRAPSVVHLASLETWALEGVEAPAYETNLPPNEVVSEFGVAPSRLWDAFEQTVSSAEAGFGEDGCLIVLADTSVPPRSLPDRVARFFEAGAGAGGGADGTRAVVGIEPPTASARASLLARGAAALVRGAVAPALAAAAARDARARRAAEADARAGRAGGKRRRDSDAVAGEDALGESAAAELRRLARARRVESELVSRRQAHAVLSEKARVARDAVRRFVAHAASSLFRDARFKPALREVSTPGRNHLPRKNKNAFRAAVTAGAAGEFGAALEFLAALRKASGKHGAFKGNVPDRWGVYPSRTASHAPADRGAAVAAALDRAAFALSGDDARLGERRAAEAEAAAEAARLEVRATATRLETIVNEGIEGITESRDDDETRRDTPMSHQRITPSAAAVSEIHLSATPKKSAEARAFAADVAGAVRDTEETVTRDASVAAAAAALAKALVEGTTIPSSRNSEMSFGAVERALGAVSVILTRAARGATGARALNLPGLIEDQRAEIERVCRAACAEDAEATRVGRNAYR